MPQTLTLLSGNFGFITHIVKPAAQKVLYSMSLLWSAQEFLHYEEYGVHELSKSWQAQQRMERKEADRMGGCVYKNAWDKLEMTKLICQDQESWWSVLTIKLYRGSGVKLSANRFEWKFFSFIFKDKTIKTNDSDNKHTNWSKWKLETSHTWVLALSCWPDLLNHTQPASLLMSHLMTQIK